MTNLHNFRYRSFTNWVKTFDEYQRQASKKGFMVDFRKSNDLECPATLTKMPCKGQLSEWRDLNECVFHICEDPFEFGKLNRRTSTVSKYRVRQSSET